MDEVTAKNQDGLWIRSRWFVGVDLGQSHDPTAIAVVEQDYAEIPPGTWTGMVPEMRRRLKEYKAPLFVRHLERLPLGMPYPDQVAYVAELITREPLREPRIFIDYTGVGRPVYDLFNRARLPRLHGISITGGNEVNQQNRIFSVPKRTLMSTLQALLHTGRLQITAGIKDGPVLLKEMKDFRAGVTSAGNFIFNAREGAHDDLVLAVAMAVFGATLPSAPKAETLANSPLVRRLTYGQ